MENQTLSLGESRVRTQFNPSKDSTVDQIKQKTAELINMVEDIRQMSKSTNGSGEAHRLCSLAQTSFEEAAMWAVKAATI